MENEKKTRFIKVSDWPKYHAWPPLGGLRHLIFKHEEKRFTNIFKKVGDTMLIDENAFFQWIESEDKLSKKLKEI